MRAMAIAAATTILVLVPWWIRNWLVFGAFVPLTSSGSSGLWIGVSSPDGWVQLPKEYLVGGELNSARLFAKEAWLLIAAEPISYVINCLAKIPSAFAQSNHPIGLLFTMKPERHSDILMAVGWLPTFASLAMLVMSGGAVLARSAANANRFLFAALAYIPLVAMWFEFSARHRYYLTPLLLLVAATVVAQRKDEATKRETTH
jgi:hypothetical protein